jgi:hypothetical protein
MNGYIDKKLERIIEAAGEFEPDVVVHIKIAHDPGCPAIKTHRLTDCTCDPNIERIKQNFRQDIDG